MGVGNSQVEPPQGIVYHPENTNTSSTNQYYEDTPNCMYIIFMLPFPFFCLGCCLSQTSKFYFDNSTRNLTLVTYCGYCICCKQTKVVSYNSIHSLQARIEPGVRINEMPAFKAYLVTSQGQIPISAAMMYNETHNLIQQLTILFRKCDISQNVQHNQTNIVVPLQMANIFR